MTLDNYYILERLGLRVRRLALGAMKLQHRMGCG
jgi:hypothetical protein